MYAIQKFKKWRKKYCTHNIQMAMAVWHGLEIGEKARKVISNMAKWEKQIPPEYRWAYSMYTPEWRKKQRVKQAKTEIKLIKKQIRK